jgi:hypothetical protein
MIMLASLALAAGSENGIATFRAGAWDGRCLRMKRSVCVEFEAVSAGAVTLRFKRNASTTAIFVEPRDCKPPYFPRSINPAYSATTLTYMIRGHVVFALQACKSKLPIPELLADDTAELLRQTHGVQN